MQRGHVAVLCGLRCVGRSVRPTTAQEHGSFTKKDWHGTPGTPEDACWSAVLSRSQHDNAPRDHVQRERNGPPCRSRENHVALCELCGRRNWTNLPRMFEMLALDAPLAGASFGVWVETTTSGTRVHSVNICYFFCAIGDCASGSLCEMRGTGTFFLEISC